MTETKLPDEELTFILKDISELRSLAQIRERYEYHFHKSIKIKTILDVMVAHDKDISLRRKRFIESANDMAGAQRSYRQQILQDVIVEALTERVVGVYKLGEHVEEIKKKDLTSALAAVKQLREEQYEREKTDISKEKNVRPVYTEEDSPVKSITIDTGF